MDGNRLAAVHKYHFSHYIILKPFPKFHLTTGNQPHVAVIVVIAVIVFNYNKCIYNHECLQVEITAD